MKLQGSNGRTNKIVSITLTRGHFSGTFAGVAYFFDCSYVQFLILASGGP